MRKIHPKNKKKRRAQNEIVGFALILIIVAVAFIIFISIYITKSSEESEDYQAKSFVQALLQYTTTCEDEGLTNVTVQNLIKRCYEQEECYREETNPHGETDSCVVLNDTIKEIIKESWKIGPQNPNIGYSFIISFSDGIEAPTNFLNITEGNVVTNNYRIGYQSFGDSRTEEYTRIIFKVYTLSR